MAVDNIGEPHYSPVHPNEDARTILINEVNWGAVFAGAAMALVVHLLLSIIGLAIGVSSVDPNGPDNPSVETFSIGAGIWWALSGIIAAFAGGIAAGRLAGTPKESTAAWHGLMSWAVTTLFIFYIVSTAVSSVTTSAVQAVSGAASGLVQATGGAVRTAVQGAAGNQTVEPFSSIERSLRSATGQDPAAARDAAIAAMRAVVTSSQADADAARAKAAEAIAQARGIPVAQATEEVRRYERQYRDAVASGERQVAEAAEAAQSTVSTASIFATISLLIGAVASWFGGRTGVVSPTVTYARIRSGSRRLLDRGRSQSDRNA